MPDGSTSAFQQDFYETPDGARLWYELRGDRHGMPAILCDGLGCDGFIWKYLFEPLAAERRVLHWNYRGHGKSGVPRDDTRLGVDFICDDLLRLLDHTGVERGVIFGHSIGVQVSLEFQRRHPGRVAGLVLLCGTFGTPLDTWHDHSLLRVAFPYLRRLVERSPAAAKAVTGVVLSNQLAVEIGIHAELNPALMNHQDFHPYMEHLAKMQPLYFVRTLDSIKDHSALEHLPHVDVPTLVVGGEIDKFTPVWLSRRMAEHIPNARYVFVPGGSHTAPLERPGLVNGEVETFLHRHFPSPG